MSGPLGLYDDNDEKVGMLFDGSTFGDEGSLCGISSSHTVRSLEKTVYLLTVPIAEFRRICVSNHVCHRVACQNLVRHLKNSAAIESSHGDDHDPDLLSDIELRILRVSCPGLRSLAPCTPLPHDAPSLQLVRVVMHSLRPHLLLPSLDDRPFGCICVPACPHVQNP